jgi:hypothetical protein
MYLRADEERWYVHQSFGSWTDKERRSCDSLRRAIILETPLPDSPERYTYGVAVDVIGAGESNGPLQVAGRQHLELSLARPQWARCFEIAMRISQNMLAERSGQRWVLDVQSERECRAKAIENVEQNPFVQQQVESLILENVGSLRSAAAWLGYWIAAFGAMSDLLTVECLLSSQVWCVD